MRILFLFLALITTFPAFSAWQLDNKKSTISFVSIKKGSIAESHHFAKFVGEVSDKGVVDIIIDLSSVNTNIPIRDERMKQYLFEVEKFAQSSFIAQLNTKEISAINVGSSQTLTIAGIVDFHGQQQNVNVEVLVAKLGQDTLLVTSLKPVIIKAESFGVVAGINKLKELAGLPSIALTVPVSFVLTFNQ
jgi:polyisoprenoid-binding protein YceI